MLTVEALFELLIVGSDITTLSTGELLRSAPPTLLAHLAGATLPVMILVHAILMPRYARVFGSFTSCMVVGAFSYAGLHVLEYWTRYDSPGNAIVSLSVVLFQFFGPGFLKSYLTLRTGNAWVHLWGYHTVAPHVVLDTPIVDRAVIDFPLGPGAVAGSPPMMPLGAHAHTPGARGGSS